jgi:tRNA A-37 threonylcarbamoyl transferase component Bud32
VIEDFFTKWSAAGLLRAAKYSGYHMQTGESLSEITIYPTENQGRGFLCRSCRLIREVPGTRRIYSALWQEQPVIVKVFYRRLGGYRHTMREWRTLRKLAALQIACPEPLFYGKTADGYWATGTALIPDAEDMFDLFGRLTDTQKKIQLLSSVVSYLAHLHIRGVEQRDLHLGNFLLAANRIYLLDPARIRFYQEPVPIAKGLCQLAMLCSNWPADQEPQIEQFIRKYFAARGLSFRPWDLEQMLKMIRARRKELIRRRLKKSLRDSKRYITLKTGSLRAVFSRELWAQKQAAELSDHIDQIMNEGKILKRGNTCFVSLVEISGRSVVIKRYNHKGLWHSIRQTLKGSRARRCWLHGHRFDELKIPTPAPLAFIEKTKGPLVYCSYILNEYAEGTKLCDFLRDLSRTEAEHTETLGRVEAILRQMEQYRITHGDLKPSNIIITSRGPVLIDLDSVKIHWMGLSFRRARAKDLKRLSSTSDLAVR